MTNPDTIGLLGLIRCKRVPGGYEGSGPIAGFPMRAEIRKANDGSEDVFLMVKSGTPDPLGPLPACDGWGFETNGGDRVVKRRSAPAGAIKRDLLE